jgi:putative tryptophan/tyrosine transport system substrate-binding protein
MRRRQFITLLGAASAWPLPVRAQQRAKVARIGYLGLVSASWHTARVTAFRAGLRDLGYVEGKDIVIEFRWAESQYDRLPALAAELVRLNVDVIVTHTVPGAFAAKKATSTIPIVITAIADLLDLGLVESLARPGGNLTGLSFFNAELIAKRLELLKEVAPSLAKAAVLLNSDNAAGRQLILRALEPTAKALKVELLPFETRGPGDFEGAFAAMVSQQVGAVVLHEDPMLNANSKAIVDIVRGIDSRHAASRNSWQQAACWPMGFIFLTWIDAPPLSSTRFSRVRSQRTFRSSARPSSRRSSISGRPVPSASTCRRRSCCVPTR